MFTGIIETVGTVQSRLGFRLTVASPKRLEGLAVGESVAVDGVCLTVERLAGRQIVFRLLPETVRVTTLGWLRAGDRVNLERSVKAGSRLGGHLLLGHVDGLGIVRSRQERSGAVTLELKLPPPLMGYLSPKGPIAVDGVSLTLDARVEKNCVWVHLVSHTLQRTTLKEKVEGARVNVETDVIAKYLWGMLS